MRRETLLSHCLQKIYKKNSFSGQILLKTKETDRSESFELFTLFFASAKSAKSKQLHQRHGSEKNLAALHIFLKRMDDALFSLVLSRFYLK